MIGSRRLSLFGRRLRGHGHPEGNHALVPLEVAPSLTTGEYGVWNILTSEVVKLEQVETHLCP